MRQEATPIQPSSPRQPQRPSPEKDNQQKATTNQTKEVRGHSLT